MLTLLQALHGADSLILAAARLWAVAGELLTAGAILWALDTLARSIRAAYALGHATGRLLWPVIHWLIAAARWFAANIDWREVALIVAGCLKALAIIAWLIACDAHKLLIAASAILGRFYAAAVAPVVTLPPVAPVCHPTALLAAELSQFTCVQLRCLTGCRKKIRKTELIGLALAMV